MTTLHHAGVCVRNMEQSLRFYRDGLGLTVLADKMLNADLESLLGVHTETVRTVFLGDAEQPDSGIIELLDVGLAAYRRRRSPKGPCPLVASSCCRFRSMCRSVLSRLEGMGLGGTPRSMPTPGGGMAATVTDPDGVMVELLPRGKLSVMKS